MSLEENAMVNLSVWLTKSGFEVFWNRKNPYGFDVFRTEKSQKKPDLFIRRVENPNWWQTLIEVKPNEGGKIRDGMKILDYCRAVTNNEIKYMIDDNIIRPKYFLLATECSKKGKLFGSDNMLKPITPSGSRFLAANKYRIIPQSEYFQTFTCVRDLWAIWRDVYLREKGEKVGVLLSDVLDGGTGRAAYMYETFNYNQRRWSQRWQTF